MPRSVHGLMGTVAICLAACVADPGADFMERVEADARIYATTPIALVGRVVDERGAPVDGAAVSLIAWGDNAANDGVAGQTGADGAFVLSGLSRRAALVRVQGPGAYVEILPVDLQQPLARSALDMGDVTVYEQRPGRARLIFGGDLMMGRRYLDKDEDGVRGEAGDLLREDSLTEDTEALFRFVTDVLHSDDHTSVNLECPVTDDPATPHPEKSYVFHSYPASVDVLPGVGIDSVSLGNNHVYDYLEGGFTDTLAAVTASGLGWFGAGTSDTDARSNRYYQTLNGIDFALQGFGDIVGSRYSDDLHLVAEDEPNLKGGALELTDTSLTEFTYEEAPQSFPIPVIHGGLEYEYIQKTSLRDLFMKAIDHGAGLVVAHHPHYAHGVGVYDPGDGPRFVLSSLGNFVFDQKIFETFHSYLAVVDVAETAAGARVERMQLIPFWIDSYVPRLLVGAGLARMGRSLGHLSTHGQVPGDGIEAATVFAQGGRVLVFADDNGYVTSEHLDARAVSADAGDTGPVEVMPAAPGDSLAGLRTDVPARCEVGRDLMVLGDFEEHDVDDEYSEGDRWRQNSARFVQNSEVHRGLGAMVIMRDSTDDVRSSTWLDNKFTVEAGRELTITGYHKGQNAGELHVTVRWQEGNSTTSHTTEYKRAAGTYDWSRFAVDLTVPAGVDGIKFYFRHYPPSSDEGQVFLDDIALVQWDERSLDGGAGASLATPNDWGYVRCQAAGDVSSLGLELTHRVYQRS